LWTKEEAQKAEGIKKACLEISQMWRPGKYVWIPIRQREVFNRLQVKGNVWVKLPYLIPSNTFIGDIFTK
jgi:hypothetical protein